MRSSGEFIGKENVVRFVDAFLEPFEDLKKQSYFD